MVGNTVKFIGNEETLGFLIKNDCSPRKIYPRPPDYPTSGWPWYSCNWEEKFWGTDNTDICEYYIVYQGLNGFVCWFHTESPPYGFYKHLAEKFPDLYIYAEAGFITQCSYIKSYFVADFDHEGKRRYQQMEWEEEEIFGWQEEVPREEELNYNVYEELEKEEQEEIDQLLPYELYGWDEPCMLSAYHGMFDDHDWVTYGVWLQGMKDLEAWGEMADDEYEIPTEEIINHDVWKDLEKEDREEIPHIEEDMFDDMRVQYPQYYNASVLLGCRIPNYLDWDYYEEDIYRELKSRGWWYTEYDNKKGIVYYTKDNEEINLEFDLALEDMPTEEELLSEQEIMNDLDMWYYITGSTSPKEKDSIECDLWDMYHWWKIWWSETNDGNGIPAPSGMGYMYMIDFLGKYIPESFETINDTGLPREEELNYNVYELIEKEEELEIPTTDEETYDQARNEYIWYWYINKVDDILEDIRFQYGCHSIWRTHTDEEPKDIFSIEHPICGYWYLKHENGDVFHSEDEGIVEYLKLLSEHDVYEVLEKEEEEDFYENEKLLHDEIYWQDRYRYKGYWNPSIFLSWPDILQNHDVYLDIENEEQEEMFYEIPYEEEIQFDLNRLYLDYYWIEDQLWNLTRSQRKIWKQTMEGWREYELELNGDEEDIPTEEELDFDDFRADKPGWYECTLELGWTPQQYDFSSGVCIGDYWRMLQDSELPREEELNYNVYEMLDKENQEDIDHMVYWDGDVYHPCTWGYDVDHKWDLCSYDHMIEGYLDYWNYLEEEALQEDYEDCCIYQDNNPQIDDDE